MSLENEILPDNPAARLQSLLDQMLNIQYAVNEKVSVVFSRALAVESNPSKLFPHYSQLFILLDDAYDKVMHYYPKQERTHKAWHEHFTNTFRNHSPYHHDWHSLISAIRQYPHLDMVQVATDNLEHFVRPTQVNGLTNDELEREVSDLIDNINDANELSDYLKSFLKEELGKILSYIKYFNLYGSDPIRKSIYNIIGNSEVAKKSNVNIIKGISVFLISIASAIGVVNDVSSFPASIENLKSEFHLQHIEFPKVLSNTVEHDINTLAKSEEKK